MLSQDFERHRFDLRGMTPTSDSEPHFLHENWGGGALLALGAYTNFVAYTADPGGRKTAFLIQKSGRLKKHGRLENKTGQP
jgi:hypothetical protein